MKFITCVCIIAVVISSSSGGFLKDLFKGSDKRNQGVTTTQEENYKPITHGTQSYLKDNSEASTVTVAKPVDNRPRPNGSKIQEPTTVRTSTDAFSVIPQPSGGKFTYRPPCPSIDIICKFSQGRGENNGRQLVCNDITCELESNKRENYFIHKCKLGEGPGDNYKITTNLGNMKASCLQESRTIFNPQSRDPCPAGQKLDIGGNCRYPY